MLGATARGQALAALFCATLPAGILASSGAKNDYVLAMWLIAATYFALRFARLNQLSDALFLGGALGLGLLTKATGYLFAPWLLAGCLLTGPARDRKRLTAGALIAIAIALAINSPQYVRNFGLSGSILGYDSAQGDGFFRWRNETFGWRQTTSNMLRNLSDQLGGRSDDWNYGVYQFVVEAHKRLGIDINDSATTWRWSVYGPPVNANHEANAPNRWHLAILFLVACVLIWRAFRGRDLERAWYALALALAFVTFCAYLKWQPFFARLLLPLFVLGAPLVSVIGEVGRTPVQVALCLFLLYGARPAVLENWVRPLKGPRSVLHTNRDTQYFADMTQWNNQGSYFQTVELLARSRCSTIAIDITDLQLEYPIQALVRERNAAARFVHSGVQNVSARYPQVIDAEPCAVVCLDCAGDAKRLSLYQDFGDSELIDRFVVFLRSGID
jgi:4-amino-4-deoxy-L-arabinose transferase-like glycosyltransferase